MSAPTYGAAGTYYENSSASVDFAAPASVVADSVVIIVAYVDGASDPTITPPTGFTQAEGSPVYVDPPGGATQNHRLVVMWHRATGSESGPYTMTLGASRFVAGQAHRYDGVVTSGTPIDSGTSTNGADTASTSTPTVSITTAGADRLVLHAATDWAGGTWTPATGYTKRQQASVGSSTLSDKSQAAAGSTGSVVATSTGNDKMQAWLGALIPTAPTTTVNAGNAAGTGAANAAVPGVSPAAGAASGTGAAYDATVIVSPAAGVAAGTGTAYAATPGVGPAAGAATGTGTASAATPGVAAAAGAATGTGTAPDAVGAGNTANPAAGHASGTGAAYDATVTTQTVETGSWGPLLALVREARTAPRIDPREAARCPNDGTVLLPDPRGHLRCPFDGYRR